MEQGKEYYAFISYKREDEKGAKWLQEKLGHYRRSLKVWLVLAFTVLSITAKAQVDMALVRQQINFHKEWMKEHTPEPNTLNDSALIVETVRAIISCCIEPQIGAMIRYTGKQYELQELIRYADMRDHKDIDRDEEQAIKCLERLADEAHHLFGEASYPEAYACLKILGIVPFAKERIQWASRLSDITEKLYKNAPNNSHQEIWLMAQVCGLVFYEDVWEVPTTYKDMRLITQQVFDFYQHTQHRSDVQVDLLLTLYSYYSGCYLYSNYYTYINKILRKEGFREDMKSWIPKDIGIESTDLPLPKIVREIYSRLLHPNHPDVLAFEASNVLTQQFDGDDVLPRLRFIQAFQKEYDERRHWASWPVNQNIREWQIAHKEPVTDSTYLDDLEHLRVICSPANEFYRSALMSEIMRESFYPKNHIEELAAELDSIANLFTTSDKIEELSLKMFKAPLQRIGVAGHESDFYELAQEFLDCCDNYPNWSTISLGKTLIDDALRVWNDVKTAIMLQRRITLLLKTMVGDKSPLFLMEYLNYVQLVSNNPQRTTSALEEGQELSSMFDDFIQRSSIIDIEFIAYQCAGSYYCNMAEYQKGRDYLRHAIEKREEKSLQNPSDDSLLIADNKYEMASLYGAMLSSYTSEYQTAFYQNDSVRHYGRLLEDQMEGMTFSVTNWTFYEALATYYVQTCEFSKAKTLLLGCLSSYDQQTGEFVDGPYVRIIQYLIQLAAQIENDMNLCQELVERMEHDLHGFENMGSYDNYISLLRTLYDLVEVKNPYDNVLLGRYLDLLNQAITAYWSASNFDDNVWYNHVLYWTTKVLSRAANHEKYRQMALASNADMVAFDDIWQNDKERVITSVVPELQRRRAQLESEYSSARQKPVTYYQIIMCQALAAEYCQENDELAEKYYRELEGMGGMDSCC